MARPSEEKQKRAAVEEYVQKQIDLGSAGKVISINGVATALGISRNTLRKYGLDAYVKSRAEEQEKTRSARQQAKDERTKRLEAEVAELRAANEALVRMRLLIEGNADRLGIRADELYREIPLSKHEEPHK